MNLYLDTLPELDDGFRKMAGFATRLSETPENWPQELTSEIFKQLPFLSDYDVNVNLDRVEPNRGFAFGYADVANKTERPELEHEETGLPHIRIPLVIMERAAKPFSIFLDGEKVMPLTEERIREALFNPATFDLSTNPPRDPSLVEATMPPQRSGMGMGGEYKMASARDVGLTKAEFESIKHKLTKSDRDSFTNAVASGKAKWKMASVEKTAFVNNMVNRAQIKSGVKPTLLPTLHPTRLSPEEQKSMLKGASVYLSKLSAEERFVYESGLEKQALDIKTVRNVVKKQADGPRLTAFRNRMKESISKAHAKVGLPHEGDTSRKARNLTSHLSNTMTDVGARDRAIKRVGNRAAAYGEASDTNIRSSGVSPFTTKTSSILLAIAPTISESAVEAFTEKISSDQTLIAGFKRSGIAPVLVEVFENTKRASAEDRLDALADVVEPTCVTFQKLPGGDFLVKSANVNAFIEKTAAGEVVPGQEVGQAIGQEQAQGMQPGQTASAVSQPVPEEQVEPEAPSKAKPVEEFGQYKVQDTMGNSVMGHVFPTTLAWDGSFSPQPIALFTNGSAYAMQDSIVGELVGKGTNLPDDEPRGDGAFYSVEGGDAVATGPVTIGSAAAGPDGLPHLQATDSFGNPLQIIQMEGMTAPQRISDTEMAIPSTWKFMRLNNQTQLQGGGQDMAAEAPPAAQAPQAAGPEVQKQASAVTLFFNGSYNLTGGCGLEKISRDLRYDLDPVSAEFMLGVLGVDGATAKMKVAEARRNGQVKLANLKTITTMGERYATSTKTASALLKKMPDLRRDLIKEAAAIQDEGTVDSILSLNFINPENLSTFIGYIPNLEESAEKLAEMLLYSYLGMKEMPEGAVEHAMKGLEEVLVGLKSLAQTEG